MEDLKALRVRVGLSQKRLAELVGVHAMTVSKWERGVLEPNEHQRRILDALRDGVANGLRASPPRPGEDYDPIRFLAAALSLAYSGPVIDLGALSATNRFAGRVVEIARGDVMTKVVIEIASGIRIGAVITTDSTDRLRLEVGSRAIAIVKATEVIVATA